jgi:hypothetical protein
MTWLHGPRHSSNNCSGGSLSFQTARQGKCSRVVPWLGFSLNDPREKQAGVLGSSKMCAVRLPSLYMGHFPVPPPAAKPREPPPRRAFLARGFAWDKVSCLVY